MKHEATRRFFECLDALPQSAQEVARQNFELLKRDPKHPSLHLKKVGRFWSVRAGIHYRAIAVRHEDRLIWFWIGTHTEYERLIR